MTYTSCTWTAVMLSDQHMNTHINIWVTFYPFALYRHCACSCLLRGSQNSVETSVLPLIDSCCAAFWKILCVPGALADDPVWALDDIDGPCWCPHAANGWPWWSHRRSCVALRAICAVTLLQATSHEDTVVFDFLPLYWKIKNGWPPLGAP